MSTHHHTPNSYHRAFSIGVTLNIGFVIIEAVYGFLADSLALLSDAGHNLSDVVSLLLAWGASLLATSKPTSRRTYGFRRVTILASLLSAILLLMALGVIAWEAIARVMAPKEVNSMTIMVVAGIGVVINTLTAMMFFSGRQHDLNIKGAYLHMAADAAVSVGVVIAGLMIFLTDWLWLDPLISIFIVLIVVASSWTLMRDSVELMLDSVPRSIEPDKVEAYLRDQPEVKDLHDLHIWAMSTTEVALTVHLVVEDIRDNDRFLARLAAGLEEKFSIQHVTLQTELNIEKNNCAQARPGSL